MANATAPSAQRSDPIALPGEAPVGVAARPTRTYSRLAVALWVAVVALFTAFLAFGTLRVGAGHWGGRRLGARDVWPRFLGFLMDQGTTPLVLAGVTAAAVVALIASAVFLWLALALRDAEPDAVTDNAGER